MSTPPPKWLEVDECLRPDTVVLDSFVTAHADQLIHLCSAEGVGLEHSLGLAPGAGRDIAFTEDAYIPSNALSVACLVLLAQRFAPALPAALVHPDASSR